MRPDKTRIGLSSCIALVALIAITAAVVGCQPRAESGVAGWELLGQRTVTFRTDHDEIPVTLAEGLFRRIQIVVDGNALEMYDIVVHFANNEDYSPSVRQHFSEGSWSRVIDLPGASRIIRRVSFKYRSRGPGGRAVVKLYGKH